MTAAQRVTANLPPGTVYVYGTVNGTDAVWTNTGGTVWETVAPKASNDTYHVALQIYETSGKYYEAAFTLYYGLLSLIYDRTEEDAARAEYLAGLAWEDMTAAERAEWAGTLRGCYNASDLNRVGSAVEYVGNRFREYGYAVKSAPKTDWTEHDIPTPAQMCVYLDDVAELRGLLPVWPGTPELPPDMDGLTVQEANNIERILWDVNQIIYQMIANFLYCGTVQCGGWAAVRGNPAR